jgi:hypothetical protein
MERRTETAGIGIHRWLQGELARERHLTFARVREVLNAEPSETEPTSANDLDLAKSVSDGDLRAT